MNAVAVSPCGTRLATAHKAGSVRIWTTSSITPLFKLVGHKGRVTSVAFSRLHLVVSGSEDHTVRVWDASTGAELRVLEGHSKPVNAVAVSDFALVVSGGDDSTARVWDVSSGTELRRFEGHSDSVTSVVMFPASSRVVSGGKDRTVIVWDATTGIELCKFTPHSMDVTSVAVSPDSAYLVSASKDHTVRVCDSVTGLEKHRIRLRSWACSPMSVSFSVVDQGVRLLCGHEDGSVYVWETATGHALLTLTGEIGPLVAFSPDSARIISACPNNMIRVWDAQTGSEIETVNVTEIDVAEAVRDITGGVTTHVNLTGVPLGVRQMTAIGEALADPNCGAKMLKLEDCHLSSEAPAVLGTYLKLNNSLEFLDMFWNYGCFGDVNSINAFVEALKVNYSLQLVNLHDDVSLGLRGLVAACVAENRDPTQQHAKRLAFEHMLQVEGRVPPVKFSVVGE